MNSNKDDIHDIERLLKAAQDHSGGCDTSDSLLAPRFKSGVRGIVIVSKAPERRL